MRIKALAFMPRRADLTRAQFRHYYETQHVPLALRYFRFQRYVRNHFLGAPDLGFDCVSEFWPRDAAAAFALMQTAVGDRMHEDERQFADQPRIVAVPCLETHLAGEPRRDDETGVTKLALLLRSTLDTTTLIASLQAWAASTMAGRSVTLDVLVGGAQAALPADAILWVHAVDDDDGSDLRLPAGIVMAGRVLARADETPAAVLAAAGTETLS